MFVNIISFSSVCISQGSVDTQLQCDGIYNIHVNANCLQSVSVKEF